MYTNNYEVWKSAKGKPEERMRGKKEVLTAKVGKVKGMQDRRIKSANLLKASQVTLILKMSHCIISYSFAQVMLMPFN